MQGRRDYFISVAVSLNGLAVRLAAFIQNYLHITISIVEKARNSRLSPRKGKIKSGYQGIRVYLLTSRRYIGDELFGGLDWQGAEASVQIRSIS